MKFARMLSVIALVFLTASIVRADDTRINNNGGGSPGDPSCGSTVVFAQSNGFLQSACNATTATGAITTFSFEVADANTTGGGLSCASNLTNVGWTGTTGMVHNPGGIDICTLTAPTTVSLQTYWNLLLTGDPYIGGPTLSTFHNDGDCDLDDFVLGIPVNCGIHTDNLLTTGGFSPFVGGAATGLAVNSFSLPSLPEPSALSLLLVGLAGISFARRKFAKLNS